MFTIDPLTSFIELGSTLTAVSGTAYVDNAAPAVLDIWVLPSDCTYDGNVFETWGFRLVTPIDFDVQSGAFQADPSTAWDLLGGGLVNGMAVSLETGRPSTATGQFNSQQGTWYMSYTQPVVTETLDIYLAGTFTPN